MFSLETYRLLPPWSGEQTLIIVLINGIKVELPYSPQNHFPLEMSEHHQIAHIPKAYFVEKIEDVEQARFNQAQTIKVKITNLNFKEGLDLIQKTLSKTLAKIRIDPNRTLTHTQFAQLIELIPRDRLDFFEEPLPSIEDALSYNVPLAMDESFTEPGWKEKLHYPQVVAAVIKPYRVFWREIYTEVHKLAKRVVLSSTVVEDSTPIIKLATYLNLTEEPLGIDVARFRIEVVRCPITTSRPDLIAIIDEKGVPISYRELDERICNCTIAEKTVLDETGSIDTLVKMFALLRQGRSVSFNEPLTALTAKKIDSIPLQALIHLHTSGTTGAPKLVAWEFGRFRQNILDQLDTYKDFRSASHRTKLNWSRMGGMTALMRALFSEGTAVLDPTYKVDFESIVPTQIITNQDGFNAKTLLIGGAPVTSKHIAQVEAKHQVLTIYSTTELGTCIINGLLVKGTGAKITGNKLFIKKENASMLAHKFTGLDGFYQTKDRAEITDSGIQITGRYDRVINTGGEKVSLSYIEGRILASYPQITSYAFGSPDEKWGEKLCLAYATKGPFDEASFIERLKTLFKKHCIPKLVLRLPDDAPPKPSLDFLLSLLTAHARPKSIQEGLTARPCNNKSNLHLDSGSGSLVNQADKVEGTVSDPCYFEL